ncbi:MAG TPA: Lar family restriction alleviation protein [Pseudomonas lactis]|uniref:Lar family restriction alleviation protein n=1 Tax=Pseudomonas lactis TaxID=1615674 RepID=A0A921T9K4_9PSED|nr:hypothetical protein [Pseudomonas lactis]HJH21436.1 Lar family restriction alleviation protein [Pseudomonas lactis]
MTTNQTINGVPLLPCPFCGGEPYGTHDHYVHDDLSPMPCVECRSCSAHLKAGDWNRRVKPAAPPQGEPVAVFSIDATGYRCRVTLDPSKGLPSNGTKLYAEQPAPVAVALPERKHVPDFRQHPMLNKEYTGWNACLDEVARLTATVRIPEPLVMTDGLHTYEYVTGHNAAIDKMLGVKS